MIPAAVEKGIEQNMLDSIRKGNTEKTFLDKLLARDDVDRLREILAKTELSDEDLKIALYQLNSTEAKLVNYSPWERHVMLKFHIWIRADVKILQLYLHAKIGIDKLTDATNKESYLSDANKILVKDKIAELKKMYIEIIQSLSDVFLHIERTSLSIDGMAFKEALKNRFEIDYKADTKQSPPAKASSGGA